MLLVANVLEQRRKPMTEAEQGLFGIEKLNVPRSDIPAVTHVDYSARIQTVHQGNEPSLPRSDPAIQSAHRMPCDREHQLQRSRRADRRHP